MDRVDNNSIIKTTHKPCIVHYGACDQIFQALSPFFCRGGAWVRGYVYNRPWILGVHEVYASLSCIYRRSENFHIKKKIFMLINFRGSVRSLKFFCVNCFVHVLNFHDWSKPLNCLTVTFSQSTVLQCTLQHLLKQFAVTAVSGFYHEQGQSSTVFIITPWACPHSKVWFV